MTITSPNLDSSQKALHRAGHWQTYAKARAQVWKDCRVVRAMPIMQVCAAASPQPR
jgi:hypothetical protein